MSSQSAIDDRARCPDCRFFLTHCQCTERYKGFGPACTCTELSLTECALRLGPSFIYTLHVHPREQLSTMYLLKRLGAVTAENPFAPFVNLVLDATTPLEWWLEANGKSYGSCGC